MSQDFADDKKAEPFVNPSLPVFKTEEGLVRHDDLPDIRKNQHHEMSFAELTDQADDATSGRFIAIEVKSQPRYSMSMLSGLRAIGELPKVVRRILLYGDGGQSTRLTPDCPG